MRETPMEALSREKIQRALEPIAFVRRVVYLPVVGSTNDVARRLAQDGAPEATLVIADEQTAGRGRLARAWWAPPGACLLMSLLVRPHLPPIQALRLTMVAGLAAAEAIERVTSLQARLKWPNDVWLNDKKAGGILTEIALTLRAEPQDKARDRVEYAIVGLGLNINVDLAGHPELDGRATSLMMEAGRPVDRLTVLGALIERFAAWYAGITSPRLKEAWANRLITLGQWVSAQEGARQIEGLAEAVDDHGALLVRTQAGTLHRLLAGDVTLHGRPAI